MNASKRSISEISSPGNPAGDPCFVFFLGAMWS
jgi:hypothetical protein